MVLTLTAILLFMALAMEVAAIALKLTGLDMERARFQALSGITGTGFTTRESEAIVSHPVRRRIVMALMVLGHVGLAAILISVVNIRLTFAWWQVLTAVLILLVMLRVATDKFLLSWVDRSIEKRMKGIEIKSQKVCEIMTVDENYGIAEIVAANTFLVGLRLLEADLRSKDILILAIRREEGIISAPKGTEVIEEGDILVAYGNLDNIGWLLESQLK
jgi:hypothetical protein